MPAIFYLPIMRASAREQLVPPLVWCCRDSNQRSPNPKADALPNELSCSCISNSTNIRLTPQTTFKAVGRYVPALANTRSKTPQKLVGFYVSFRAAQWTEHWTRICHVRATVARAYPEGVRLNPSPSPRF